MSGSGSSDYYGYHTDYQKRSRLVRLWHQTGSDRDGVPNPLYYSDSQPSLMWTDASTGGSSANTVDVIYTRIWAQDPDAADRAADAWGKLHGLLGQVSTAIGKVTDQIQTGGGDYTAWDSKAADIFFCRGPGATMKSIHDWQAAAAANQSTMTHLAVIIRDYRTRISTLYNQYLTDLIKLENWAAENDPYGDNLQNMVANPNKDNEGERNLYVDYAKWLRAGDFEKNHPGSTGIGLNRAIGLSGINYNAAAQKIQQDMANEYAQAIGTLSTEGRSTRYEGPTNAVTVDSKTLQRILRNYYTPDVEIPTTPTVPNVNVPIPDTTAMDDLLSLTAVSVEDVSGIPTTDTVPSADLPSVNSSGMLDPLTGVLPSALAPNLAGSKPGAAPLTPPTAGGASGSQPFAPGRAPGPPGGLLGNRAGLPSAPVRPVNPRDPRGRRRGLNRGVLGTGATLSPDGLDQEELSSGTPGAPGMRMPPAMGRPGTRQPGTPAPPGSASHTDTFGADAQSGASTSPPVLGRPRPPAARKLRKPGKLTAEAPGTSGAYTPTGTTPPVLGAASPRIEAPRGGGSRRARQQPPTAAGYPPLPMDTEWVNRPVDGVAPAAPAVLDAASVEPAGGANDLVPGMPSQPGATSAVIGRRAPVSAASGTGWRDKYAIEQELGARRRAVAPPSGVAPAEEMDAPAVAGDEDAFTVETPGGSVLGTGGDGRGYETEPKPILGAGG